MAGCLLTKKIGLDTNSLDIPAPIGRCNGALPALSREDMQPSAQASPPAPNLSRWFTEEVQPHESSLRSYLRNVFPSLPDIDDLVQESYVRLIRARQEGRVSYVKAFLFTAARNVALDFFRRRKIVSIDPAANLGELTALEDSPDAAEATCKQQELELLAAAIRTLPDRCRQVLTLRQRYGLSHKEIAAELRISEHTVKAQLAKGMRRCAEYLEERGLP